MTISTQSNRIESQIVSGTHKYPFNYSVLEATWLMVVQVEADGTETTLELNTDYTVEGVGRPDGGNVVFADQYTIDNDGKDLVILRVLNLVQLTRITNQGKYLPEVHELVFDYLTRLVQQLQEQINRSVKIKVGSSGSPDDLLTEIDASVSAAAGYAQAAGTSEENAGNSAGAASASETNAENAAQAAADYAAAINPAQFLQKAGGKMVGRIDFADAVTVASAPSVDLTNVAGNLLVVSGTENIAEWIMADGQIFAVIFTGAGTLTHEATKNNLPGEANIARVALDRALIAKAGGTVYVIDYTKKNGRAVVEYTPPAAPGKGIQVFDVGVHNWVVPAGVRWVYAKVQAPGGGARGSSNNGTSGGTCSFGAFLSCTGGAAGTSSTNGVGGSATGAQYSRNGSRGVSGAAEVNGFGGAGGFGAATTSVVNQTVTQGFLGGGVGHGLTGGVAVAATGYGNGGSTLQATPNGSGGGGGYGEGWYEVVPGDVHVVTVVAAPGAVSGSSAASNGRVILEW